MILLRLLEVAVFFIIVGAVLAVVKNIKRGSK